MGLFNYFSGGDLRSSLGKTKRAKINGVVFRIKKIDVLDFLDGSNVLARSYQTYEEKKKPAKSMNESTAKAAKKHYRDVLLSGVVSPKLCRKEDDEGVFVDDMFVDMDMVEQLYISIFEYTYGKKKVQLTRVE